MTLSCVRAHRTTHVRVKFLACAAREIAGVVSEIGRHPRKPSHCRLEATIVDDRRQFEATIAGDNLQQKLSIVRGARVFAIRRRNKVD